MDRKQFLGAAVTGSLILSRARWALAARLGGTPVVFVTADLESHVVVLDLDGTTIRRRIPTGPGPRSIESVHDWTAVVAHTQYGVISLLDAATSRVRAEIDGFDAPRYTAVHPRRPFAYVTDSSREEVVVVDAEKAKVIGRARVPGPARHVSITRDGRTLWTALGRAAPRVAVLDTSDPRRPRLVRTVTPPFLAHDVVFAPDGRTAWVTSGAERRIAIYRNARPVRILDAGAPPQHVTFARDKVFVASGDDGTVHRHRLDGVVVREAKVPIGSYNITYGWGSIVTPSLDVGIVSSLGPTGRVKATERVARAAHDACVVFGP